MVRRGLVVIALAGAATFAQAAVASPSPGVVAGGFCTYGKGYFQNSPEAAQRLNQYFGKAGAPTAGAREISHVGSGANTYTWEKTGTTVTVGHGNNTVQVDSGVEALQEALGGGGKPGALSESLTNPTDTGTGGVLAAQALALKINQGFSEIFVTPASGFSGLSLVDMDGVKLDGSKLTPAQADALNGQATLQLREAADAALGGGPLPYGLSFSQLTDLLELVNDSFESCAPSAFAQAHLYQPYVTSSAFAGKRPSTVSTFAYKPSYNSFSGEVVYVGRGCPARSVDGTLPNQDDEYLADPKGKIALIERGGCRFDYKVAQAQLKGAAAVIIFNNQPTAGCPAVPTGSNQCEALLGMAGNNPVVLVPPPTFTWTGFGTTITIPAAFVQRSTGLALQGGTAAAPVTAFVQQ